MAKSPAPAPAPAPAAADTPFAITWGEGPSAIARKVGSESSPYAATMKALKAPDGDKHDSFFVTTGSAPETYTDAKEIAKWKTEEARKITNRIAGLSRRLQKKDTSMTFALRTKTENDVLGVRVYRVVPTPAPTPTA